MKFKNKEIKLKNLFGEKGILPFIPFLISFLLFSLITTFLSILIDNKDFLNFFDFKFNEDINLYNKKIVFLFFFCLTFFITFIFLIYKYKFFGFLIFLINFLFISFFVWFFLKIIVNYVYVINLKFIWVYLFFYFGIYFQTLFLNFYKKYTKNQINIFLFLKSFFIQELVKIKYYFLIVLFIMMTIFLEKFKYDFYIIFTLIIISLIVQFSLFLFLMSFFFYFFDFFVKKNLNGIKERHFNYLKIKKINIFKLKIKKEKLIFWTLINFFFSFFILGIISIIFILILPKFLNINVTKSKIILEYTTFIKNISLICLFPMLYISLRYKVKGLFVYVFLFPIKLILFSVVFFYLINFFLIENINIVIILIFFTFLLDFLLTENFLNFCEKKEQIKKSDFNFYEKISFFNKKKIEIKIFSLFLFINIFILILRTENLNIVFFIGLIFIILIIVLLLSIVQKIFYIFSIKVNEKINLKINKNFSNLIFKSGKEEEI